MREVELAAAAGQPRLAVAAAFDPQPRRVLVQVLSEDRAQQRAPAAEAMPVAREEEAVAARSFVRGERALQAWLRGRVEPRLPHVDLARGQYGGGWRSGIRRQRARRSSPTRTRARCRTRFPRRPT